MKFSDWFTPEKQEELAQEASKKYGIPIDKARKGVQVILEALEGKRKMKISYGTKTAKTVTIH